MDENKDKPKTKEKKYFGFMDFEENTNKWGKVFLAALLFLMFSLSLSKIYDTYINKEENPVEQNELAQTDVQKLALVEKETEMELTETNETFMVEDLEYELYQVENEQEYVLAGWEDSDGKGQILKTTVKGVEEKELILTSAGGDYLFVWGNPEKELEIKNDGVSLGTYAKEPMDKKLVLVDAESAEKITFE